MISIYEDDPDWREKALAAAIRFNRWRDKPLRIVRVALYPRPKLSPLATTDGEELAIPRVTVVTVDLVTSSVTRAP
jgi:hypothetical protein